MVVDGGRIYLVTNLLNGKKYVGCTDKTVAERWKQHVRKALRESRGSVSALHRAIRKYGENSFSIALLEEIRGNRSDLLNAEIRHVAEQRSLVPSGYNLTPGGGGMDFSVPEMRQRHLDGISRRSEKKEWRDVLERRSLDEQWQRLNAEHLKKLHTDPVLRAAQVVGLRRKFEDPQYQKEQAERTRRTTQSDKWKAAHAEGIKKRSTNPVWQAQHEEKLKKAWTTNAEKVRMRDEASSPEERERRERRRESCRRSAAKRKKVREL